MQTDMDKLRDKAKKQLGAPAGGPTKTTNVGDIAAEYMGEDSRLTRLAKTEGAQAANRRGLLNSSIAEGAKMDSVARAVVPLATQEASQRHAEKLADKNYGFQSALQEKQGEIASSLSAQESGQRKSEAATNFGFSSSLQQQQGNINKQISLQESQQRQAENQKNFGFQSALSSQASAQKKDEATQAFGYESQLRNNQRNHEVNLAKLDADSRRSLMSAERAMRESLAEIDISRQERTNAASMVEKMHSLYQSNVNTILNNKDMNATDRNRLLASAGDFLTKQTQLIRNMFQINLDWSNASIR